MMPKLNQIIEATNISLRLYDDRGASTPWLPDEFASRDEWPVGFIASLMEAFEACKRIERDRIRDMIDL